MTTGLLTGQSVGRVWKTRDEVRVVTFRAETTETRTEKAGLALAPVGARIYRFALMHGMRS